ncbi:beta-ketoacyl synthase N-terminal-like domain-containing protein, partial [Pirellulales bacterium]|nr:beta-ketoacyl synthase N-terminal-like domain-containing protein [Pirellulales bacterium]
MHDPIVITGIGLVTAVGEDRESTWQAVQNGVSGVRRLERFGGLPDGSILAAPISGYDPASGGQKNVPVALTAARESITDSGLCSSDIPPERFGSAIGVNTGESPQIESIRRDMPRGTYVPQWWREFMPNNTAAVVPQNLGLLGPRLCCSTACATGSVALLQAARALQDGQCDAVLAGAAQSLHPLLVAGFRKMRVLAQHDDPQQ